jgi:rhamnogalacturonan endolyase
MNYANTHHRVPPHRPPVRDCSRICKLALALLCFGFAWQAVAQDQAVTIKDDGNNYILSNGIVTARIGKRNSDLESLVYKGVETMTDGYWEQRPTSAQMTDSVTIDPQSNGGQLGEVSIRGISGGQRLGNGPGGGTGCDIEVRYALQRGVSGIYAYSIFSHPASYPATGIGESRFCAKLNDDVFDWMTVDANRNMKMISTYDWDHGTPMNMKEARRMNSGIDQGKVEHKYDYSANQFDVLAWGWSSTGKHVGFWFINPTDEYLSGGPTKYELSAHRDATFGTDPNAPAPPCLLNYWRGSHYGGSECNIAQGEQWSKIVGPFLVYCNSGDTPDAMWHDALAQSKQQTAAWPFDWVNGVDYPHKDQRATVSGKLVLNDPLAPMPMSSYTRLLVGLAAPAEGNITWQNDAKHYEFWARGASDGTFSIPNVRPGAYTLYAIADGVLGEYSKTDVTVQPGVPLDLRSLTWQPVRFGKQLWDIGIPNRDASEFLKGDDYFHWGWYLEYPKLFPNDVNYTVGQSDFHKDWFFEQVPHNADPNNDTGTGQGRATTWTINYNLPDALQGNAILRLAICGVGARSIEVRVNNTLVGTVTGLRYNATINRDGIGGFWTEKDVPFNASAMHSGQNVMTLTIPAGGLTSGVMYDYIRLEFVASGNS